jgi:hypothetical protein
VGDSLLNSFHIVPPDASRQTVNCTTLKDIFTEHGLETIDLLKINCEGAEYEILEGCSGADFDRISNIRLEYHNLDTKKNGESLSVFLQAQGYRIERFSRYRNSSGFIWATRTRSEDFPPISVRNGFGTVAVKILIASFPDALSAIV